MQVNLLKKEFIRKGFHLIFGIIFLFIIWQLGTGTSLLIIGTCLVVGAIISIIIKKGFEVPLFSKTVLAVEREKEKSWPGKAAIFFFISAAIVLILFKDYPTIVLASISVQVFADTAAALVGIPFGKHKFYRKKSWEGTITCFIVALACLLFFYSAPTAIIAAIVATVIEVLPLDDNLWVPIGTGVTLRLLL